MTDKYSKHEPIAGHSPWYLVIGYRIELLFVDIFSIAAVFAACTTWMMFKYYSMLQYMIDNKTTSTVIITFIGLGLLQMSAWILAFVYYCARKYTPPIVEAIAIRIAGKAQDFKIDSTSTETSITETLTLEEPPEPVKPKGWDSILKKAEELVKSKIARKKGK